MFKKLFNGYRNKSRQAGKLKWVIYSFVEKKAKHFANMIQSKSQRIPATQMRWYVACFCAIGLTLSLVSILASGTPNRSAVTVKQMTVLLPKKFSNATVGSNEFRNYQRAVRMEQYFDSLLQSAHARGQADSFLQHHRGLQDSIRLLKSLYRQE